MTHQNLTTDRRELGRQAFRELVADLADPVTGLVDLQALLYRSTRWQDAAAELGWTEYADELQALTATAQTAAELYGPQTAATLAAL